MKSGLKTTFTKASDLIPGHLSLFSHVHDQNSGSGGSGSDDGFSGRECPKTGIFKLVSTFPTFFPRHMAINPRVLYTK